MRQSKSAPQTNAAVDEIWQSGNYSPAINRAVQKINEPSYEDLIADLGQNVTQEPNGITYVLLGENSSKSTCLVMFSPFANDVSANMLVRGEFIRRAVAESGFRDADGASLPICVFGSPSGRQGLKLSRVQAVELNSNLEYFARKHMEVVKALGFEQVFVLGFSQGAHVALEAAMQATKLGLKVSGVAIGEPPSVRKRSVRELARAFMYENRFLKDDVVGSGVDATITLHGFHLSGWRALASGIHGLVAYVVAILRQQRTNMAIVRNMSKPIFEDGAKTFLAQKTNSLLVVGYGTASTITPEDDICKAVKTLKDQFGRDSLKLIAVKGGHHSWGDNLPLLAAFYLECLGRKLS